MRPGEELSARRFGSGRVPSWTCADRAVLQAGTLEATPGTWRIDAPEWDYRRMLSGRSVICADGDDCVEVGPGDGFVLRPGFKGTWEVLETTRKEYVVRM